MAIMCTRFRPAGVDSQGVRHVMLAVGADGSVRRWHVSTGKMLFETFEKDNEVFTCDYRESCWLDREGVDERAQEATG
jgi:hypothetical protein